jgi:hypothetical protein
MKVSNYNRRASDIPTLLRRALTMCAAIAALAGCGGASNVAPTQESGQVPNLTQAVRTVAPGVTELRHHKKTEEQLKSTSGSSGGASCYESVSVSGEAWGPYRGTFTGSGHYGICRSDPFFWGSFVITSGANTITGSFSGPGQGECGRGGCSDGGKMTYTATVEPGGKAFSGRGNAEMHDYPDSTGSLNVTLNSM